MEIKFDFGTTHEIPTELIARAISEYIAQSPLKCCKATIYLSEYDGDGRWSFPVVDQINNDTGEVSRKEFGYLIRNKRYKKNEETKERHLIGKYDTEPECYLYQTFKQELEEY